MLSEDGSSDGYSYGYGYGHGGYGYVGVYTDENGEVVGEVVDEDGDGIDGEGGEKRKHECTKCGKKFNRPSSLKIHLNTHTGAKRESLRLLFVISLRFLSPLLSFEIFAFLLNSIPKIRFASLPICLLLAFPAPSHAAHLLRCSTRATIFFAAAEILLRC